MMRLLTTLLLAAVCTACGGPSRDGNAFTFDEAGMAYRVEFRTENTVRILVRPAGSPLVTRRLVVDSVPAAPVEVRREAIEHGYAFRTPARTPCCSRRPPARSVPTPWAARRATP